MNSRPPDYESGALPLSYCGKFFQIAIHALERTRTAMPYGTTPSRWRVYQFHHQGKTTSLEHATRSLESAITKNKNGADGARTRDLSSDSRVL